MAVTHDLGNPEEERSAFRVEEDRHAGAGAEWMVLLTVAAVAGMEIALLAWLIL